jgi:hypothetical protein
MSFALAARSLILIGYLVALGAGRQLDAAAGLTALAVLTVWSAALLRDRHTGRL